MCFTTLLYSLILGHLTILTPTYKPVLSFNFPFFPTHTLSLVTVFYYPPCYLRALYYLQVHFTPHRNSYLLSYLRVLSTESHHLAYLTFTSLQLTLFQLLDFCVYSLCPVTTIAYNTLLIPFIYLWGQAVCTYMCRPPSAFLLHSIDGYPDIERLYLPVYWRL